MQPICSPYERMPETKRLTMGTRHLTAVQLDGEYKIAQYGQWDGYPSGQGIDVLKFLNTANLEAFRDKLRRVHFSTPEEQEAAWVEAGASPGSKLASISVGDALKKTHPELSRDTGAGVLDVVLRSTAPEKLVLGNAIKFAQDSLFCEWAYVIDLDANILEVYEGFNKNPVAEGRFAGPVQIGHDGPGSDGYGPVTLVKTYPLNALPSEAQFLADLEPESSEVEA